MEKTMCIISINKERALTKEEFTNCWTGNSDGAGFAWGDNWKKGFMTMKEAEEFYFSKVAHCLPHVTHFRIKTSGKIVPQLTHPFLVERFSPVTEFEGKTTECAVLFHNGIISDWEKILANYAIAEGGYPTGALSDTRVLAMAVSRGTQYIIPLLGGTTGKFVLFKAGKIVAEFGNWEDSKDGVLFSNGGYKYSYRNTYTCDDYWPSRAYQKSFDFQDVTTTLTSGKGKSVKIQVDKETGLYKGGCSFGKSGTHAFCHNKLCVCYAVKYKNNCEELADVTACQHSLWSWRAFANTLDKK